MAKTTDEVIATLKAKADAYFIEGWKWDDRMDEANQSKKVKEIFRIFRDDCFSKCNGINEGIAIATGNAADAKPYEEVDNNTLAALLAKGLAPRPESIAALGELHDEEA